ncbi:aldo/keto reductase [Caulobacter segnis]
MSDAAANAVIEAALAAGIRYFDTAPHYGFGLSETRLGEALERRDVMISTKVGRRLEPVSASERERHGFVDAAPFEPVFDYTHDGVMRLHSRTACAASGVTGSTCCWLTTWGSSTHGDAHVDHMRDFLEGGCRAMCALKDSGAVGAIGLGVNEQAVCEEVLDHADVDVFLLAGRYTLLEQTALESFPPRCVARGVGSSWAVRSTRARWSRRVGRCTTTTPPRRLKSSSGWGACVGSAPRMGPLAAAALQFPLAHPAVRSVVPGMATVAQVVDATHWSSLAIPDALWSDLRSSGLIRADAPIPVSKVAA